MTQKQENLLGYSLDNLDTMKISVLIKIAKGMVTDFDIDGTIEEQTAQVVSIATSAIIATSNWRTENPITKVTTK